MSNYLKEVNAGEFDSIVFNTPGSKVFVDFFADWCGPCRMMIPVIEEVAKEYDGKVSFVKVNVDKHPEIAAKFGITGIPRFIFFKDGEAIEDLTGARPKAQVIDFLEKNI